MPDTPSGVPEIVSIGEHSKCNNFLAFLEDLWPLQMQKSHRFTLFASL